MKAEAMKYKKTGIDWMPEVPEHWELRRLGSIGKFSKGGNISRSQLLYENEENTVAAILYGDIYTKYDIVANEIFNRISKTTASKSVLLEKGDLLFTGSGETKEDIGKCVLFNSDVPTYAGGDVIIFKQSIFDGRYISYSQNSTLAKYQKYISSKGEIIVHTYGSKLRDVILPYPPIGEQNAIADRLDIESTKITHFIQKKQRFIELLKEQRQSIITNAVTKGIDEKAKMKETGIDWIGQVPQNWEIRRFKNICVLQRGHDLPKEKFKEGDFPVYGSNGIIGYHKEFTTKSPCITIGRSGSVGEINFVEKNFWAHNTCLFIKENYGNDWEYLFFLISSIDIKMVSNGSAVPTLDRNNVHSLRVSYPPTINEQTQIVEHIKSETKTLDIAISKAEREIELIKEYREAMIAEAVTGKMKL